MNQRIPVILTTRKSPRLMRRMSLRQPDALVVSTGGHFILMRNGAWAMAPARSRYFLIALAANGLLTPDQATELIWGSRRDGGPDDIKGGLAVVALNARSLGAALGIAVDKDPMGWRARSVPLGERP